MQGLRHRVDGEKILPFVRAFCGQPSTYSWEDDAGEIHTHPTRRGGEQGDPLIPSFFCLGQHPALTAVSAGLEAVEKLFDYLDDLYVVCCPGRVGAVHSLLGRHLWHYGRPHDDFGLHRAACGTAGMSGGSGVSRGKGLPRGRSRESVQMFSCATWIWQSTTTWTAGVLRLWQTAFLFTVVPSWPKTPQGEAPPRPTEKLWKRPDDARNGRTLRLLVQVAGLGWSLLELRWEAGVGQGARIARRVAVRRSESVA